MHNREERLRRSVGALAEISSEEVAKKLYPALWSEDPHEAHRAASPHTVRSARDFRCTEAQIHLEAIGALIVEKG